MTRKFLKKSEVIQEGYIKGLRKANRIISEMLMQTYGFDNDRANKKLFTCARKGDLNGVREALNSGADINAQERGRTALHNAAQYGHIKVCDFLMDNGLDVDVHGADGMTPLFCAISSYTGGSNLKCCEFLLSSGADVNTADASGITPLHHAAAWGSNDVCQMLMQHGADVNAADITGNTPLHVAVGKGHDDIVETLVSDMTFGWINVDAKNDYEETPLQEAVHHGNTTIIKILLDAGANEELLSGEEREAMESYI